MTIQTILPDPSNPIDNLGENVLGTYGPGFSSVKLTSKQPVVTNRSNSGIAFRSLNSYHSWNVDITYNEMTKTTFQAVYNFLLEKQASLEPFYVELPQYGNATAGSKPISADVDAGLNEITLANITGINPGDLFYISDPDDDTHAKTYKVTRLGSSNNIFVSPVVQRDILGSSSAYAVFGTPLIRVIMANDNLEYTLNSNNLYSLSLKLEEALS